MLQIIFRNEGFRPADSNNEQIQTQSKTFFAIAA